eukprot:359517-Chlamydomonas_euryale.AAC.16
MAKAPVQRPLIPSVMRRLTRAFASWVRLLSLPDADQRTLQHWQRAVHSHIEGLRQQALNEVWKREAG